MDVAIKTAQNIWMSAEELKKELDKEASMLHNVRHAAIVTFYGAGTMPDGRPFLVSELMDQGSLWHVLRNTTLDWPIKIRFAAEIASGMAQVHALDRIHRDLKSQNVLVKLVAGKLRCKIADFGTATLLETAASTPEFSSAAKRAHTTGVGTPCGWRLKSWPRSHTIGAQTCTRTAL
jgi:serine/threonine protein kinase